MYIFAILEFELRTSNLQLNGYSLYLKYSNKFSIIIISIPNFTLLHTEKCCTKSYIKYIQPKHCSTGE